MYRDGSAECQCGRWVSPVENASTGAGITEPECGVCKAIAHVDQQNGLEKRQFRVHDSPYTKAA